MIDMTLWLPSLLLPLFCLICSFAARRELCFPLPKGISARLRNQHTVFLAMLCVLIIAAAAGIAESAGGTGSLGLIHTAGIVLRILLFCLFTAYTRALPKADRRAAVLLMIVAAAGVLVRTIRSRRQSRCLHRFYVFGCMDLLISTLDSLITKDSKQYDSSKQTRLIL